MKLWEMIEPLREGEGVGTGDAAAAEAAAAAAAAAAEAAKTPEGDEAAAAAAAAAAEASKTALEKGGADKTRPATFPDNWRDQMANGNKDAAKELERFKSPADVAKALIEQKKVVRGAPDPAAAMPDPKTKPAEAKVWREERGIPEDAAGYKLPEPIVAKLTDADKPILENFTTFAHEHNMPASEVNKSVEWYTNLMETQAAARTAADDANASATEDALMAEWGREYKPILASAIKMATEFTGGDANLLQARLPDGRRMGDIPEVTKMFADLALLKYGDSTIVGGEAVKAAETRYEELDKKNTETGGELPPAERAEYMKLIEAREARASRAK